MKKQQTSDIDNINLFTKERISEKILSIALDSIALEKRLLNIETVTEVELHKDIIKEILIAKSKEFDNFNTTGLLEFPDGKSTVRVNGTITMTTTFQLNKNNTDFVFCIGNIVDTIHQKTDSNQLYRFLHSEESNNENLHIETDLLIKPDGMVCRLFDMDSEDFASDEMIVKYPRTFNQQQEEQVSNKKLKDELNFNVFPHLTDKSYYTSNQKAYKELATTRLRVAKALATSNHKAAKGQICQALILGFISSFYVADHENINTEPLGLNIYMPAWTILSEELKPSISNTLKGNLWFDAPW